MAESRPPLVVHIIYALGTGGLENGLVHLINGTPPGRYRHAVVCLTRAEAFAGRISAPDVPVYELGMRPGTDWGAYRRLRRLLRELRPAVVHSRNLAALEAQLATLLLPGLRRVHGEHGRDVADLDGSNWKYRLFRRAMRRLVHHYTAVSRDLADWLVASIGVSPARLRQIYNGVEVERFHPGDREAARHLLPAGFAEEGTVVAGTVGRLAEVKSQETILRALGALLRRRPDLRPRLRVVIVGEGTMRPALESAIAAEELAGCVWMPGDREDIPELLRTFDVFLLPSLGEGISNTVLEAMASGLPVAATRVGGTPELVREGHNGELFAVGDTTALATLLEDAAEDPARWRRMGEQGLAFVRARFSWPRAVEAYLGVYDRVLGVAGAPREVARSE